VNWPDLTRTEAALLVWDRWQVLIDMGMAAATTDAEVLCVLRAEDVVRLMVCNAYATDTADRNNRETVTRYMHVNDVRAMVQAWQRTAI
jgi:hypothetical protein